MSTTFSADKEEIPDGDYILTDGAAWLEAGPFAVRIIYSESQGVIDCTIYTNGKEMEEDLAGCWACREQIAVFE